MKRVIMNAALLLMIFILTFLSAGCLGSGDYKSPAKLAKERQTEIMECFINKDGETLESFLCEYVMEKYSNIDKQIDKALNFLDGEIVSYDEPFPSALGGFDHKYYGGDTRNIITDKGTEYRIIFDGYLTNDKEPEKIGITCITVINMTEGAKLPNDAPEAERNKTRAYIGEPQ